MSEWLLCQEWERGCTDAVRRMWGVTAFHWDCGSEQCVRKMTDTHFYAILYPSSQSPLSLVTCQEWGGGQQKSEAAVSLNKPGTVSVITKERRREWFPLVRPHSSHYSVFFFFKAVPIPNAFWVCVLSVRCTLKINKVMYYEILFLKGWKSRETDEENMSRCRWMVLLCVGIYIERKEKILVIFKSFISQIGPLNLQLADRLLN